MDKNKYLGGQRQRRRFRVRKRIRGSAERPRLAVFRSHRHLLCQIIDDMSGKTLVAVGTKDKELQPNVKYGGNKTAAQTVGKVLAEKAIAAGIKEVAFDRGHYRYHGRVAALADAAREAGLSF
ncbi:MAG: 50S ribosomal protein L18 [Planctomycetia bacterium]|jgi:large subunit ribosomal protein L18|nr:50S ribosomal protein L18 [Planctomycetia bacterium]